MNQDEAKALLERATPGPWAVYDSCSFRRIGTDGPYKELIYAVQYKDGQLGIGGQRGDIYLAAAAPALAKAYLEACAALQKIIEWGGDMVDADGHEGEANPREIAVGVLHPELS